MVPQKPSSQISIAEEEAHRAVMNAIDEYPGLNPQSFERLQGLGMRSVPALVRLLGHDDMRTRFYATLALERTGICTPEVEDALLRGIDEPMLRLASLRAALRVTTDCGFHTLAAARYTRHALRPPLGDMLAIHALVRCARVHADASRELEAGLSEGRYARDLVADGLSSLPMGSPVTNRLLIGLLQDHNHPTAYASAKGLALTAGRETAISVLLRALEAEEDVTREAASHGLGWIVSPPSNVTDALALALTDTSEAVREEAAIALGIDGELENGAASSSLRPEDAQEALEAIVERVEAISADSLRSAKDLRFLVLTVRSNDKQVSLACLRALSQFAGWSDESWDALRAMTTHPDPELREAAVRGVELAWRDRD